MKILFPPRLCKAAILSSGLLLAMPILAAPVDPSAAKDEAVRFLISPSEGRKAAPSNPELTLAYTAETSGEAAFYIFNHTGGFVIISADDRLPSVLGYSECGEFDEARIPDNFRWWLGEYTREISGWLPTAPETMPSAIKRASIRREPIAPMTKTTWNQDAPYNNDCPLDSYGQKSVTGCVATAMAQLMKYHQWPAKPKGSSGGVVFDGTTYDWGNMLDNYVTGEYSAKQAQAVATLMRQCGASVNMMYSSWASGAYDMSVPYAFVKYFNYSPEIRMVWKDYTPLSTWTEIVYSELSAGRPLYYSGSSSSGGHAFVCDGYSQNDLFHFNWGWGGYQDGYFRLTALNPASGGAGSYEGGYNSGQTILTGLSPNKNGITAEDQIALLSTGGFYYSKDNTFHIQQDPRGFNLIYNPLIYSESLSVGVKILEIDNPSAKPVYATAGSVTFPSGAGINEFSVSMPNNLSDGTYGITPVFKASGDWQPILIPLGKQNYVRLEVSGGKQSFANVGADDSNKANLIINLPESTPVIFGNSDMAFRVPVLNVGKGDYMGYLGFTLIDKNDDFGDAVSVSEPAPVAGKGFLEWEVAFDDHIAPGEYLLYISDDDDNLIIDGYEVTVVDGDLPEPIDTGKVTVSNLAPNFMLSETDNPVYFTVESTSLFEETIKFRFELLDAVTLEKVMELPDYTLVIPAKYQGRVTAQPRDLGVKPGCYLWYVADTNGNAISPCTPLIVTSPIKTSEGVSYIVTDDAHKEASIVQPDAGPYTGTVNVPRTIAGYNVRKLRPDAFAFSEASTVSLPESITELPDGAFYDTYYMRSLTLGSNDVVATGERTFYSKFTPNCWLNVPNNLANTYHSSAPWSDFRMTHWSLQLEDVEIISGMEIDPSTGEVFSPYFVNCFTPLTVRFSAPEGMNVEVNVVRNNDWLLISTIDPATDSIELPAIGEKSYGRLRAAATNNPVSVDAVKADNTRKDVYSVDGRIILRSATPDMIRDLEPGLYIIGARKMIVK